MSQTRKDYEIVKILLLLIQSVYSFGLEITWESFLTLLCRCIGEGNVLFKSSS